MAVYKREIKSLDSKRGIFVLLIVFFVLSGIVLIDPIIASCPKEIADVSTALKDRLKPDGDLNYAIVTEGVKAGKLVDEVVVSLGDKGNRGHLALVGNEGVGKQSILAGAVQRLPKSFEVRELSLTNLMNQNGGMPTSLAAGLESVFQAAQKQDDGTVVLVVDLNELSAVSAQQGMGNPANVFERAMTYSGDKIRFVFKGSQSSLSNLPESFREQVRAIHVGSPAGDEVFKILRSRSNELEDLYNVKISDEAIFVAIKRGNSSLQPGSGIELLTRAANKVSFQGQFEINETVIAEGRAEQDSASELQRLQDSKVAKEARLEEIEQSLAEEGLEREERTQLEQEKVAISRWLTSNAAILGLRLSDQESQPAEREATSTDKSSRVVTPELIEEEARQMALIDQSSRKKEDQHGNKSLADFRVYDLVGPGWEQIGGMTEVKDTFENMVFFPNSMPDLSVMNGIQPGGSILLEGPPGTGKTLLSMGAAFRRDEFGRQVFDEVYNIDANALTSMWLGVGPNNWRRIFAEAVERAKQGRKVYLFIDEFEVAAARRGMGGAGGASQERDAIVNAILTGLTERDRAAKQIVEADGNLTIVAATNRADMIDSAVKRPGRLDEVQYVGPPDAEGRRDIIELAIGHLRAQGRIVDEDINMEQLVEDMDGFTGAYIKDYFGQLVGRYLNDASRRIYNEQLAAYREQIRESENREITAEEFDMFRARMSTELSQMPVSAEIIQAALKGAQERYVFEYGEANGAKPEEETPEEGSQVGGGSGQ